MVEEVAVEVVALLLGLVVGSELPQQARRVFGTRTRYRGNYDNGLYLIDYVPKHGWFDCLH